jgi:hypothetical protein
LKAHGKEDLFTKIFFEGAWKGESIYISIGFISMHVDLEVLTYLNGKLFSDLFKFRRNRD